MKKLIAILAVGLMLYVVVGTASADNKLSANGLVDDCYYKKICATKELELAVAATTLAWEKAEASRVNKEFTLLEIGTLIQQWKDMSAQQLVVAERILRDKK